MQKDTYYVSLIEGLEPNGFVADVRATSHEAAADHLVKQVPYVAGFPADVVNTRTGETREIDLQYG